MIPVLTKSEAYKIDKDTVISGCSTELELMDNAGKKIAQFFCEKIRNPFSQKVLIVSGKGNNGGDGIIVHYYLKKYKVLSKIIFTESDHDHLELLERYNIKDVDFDVYNNKTNFQKYDWIIDAVFGIGLSRKLNNKYINILNNINRNNNIISIDLSSGLFTDTSNAECFIKSKHVLSLGYPKLVHYLHPHNNLTFLDIGLKNNTKNNFKLICKSDISLILKDFIFKDNINKYKKGNISIKAGSNKYPGAAILSCLAAYRSGSGYVNLIFKGNDKIRNNIKSQYPDIIVDKFPSNADFCLFGPGYDLKENNKFPNMGGFKNIVCDASLLSSTSNISDFPDNSILTPHFGEYQKLFNTKNDLTLSSFNHIQNSIKNRIIILKHFNVFIITSDTIYIMDRGPSLLAVAGSGDVLSGILVSLLAQGYSRLEASILGTYLHAEAARHYMDFISKDGMKASDLIDCIPFAFNKLRNNA